MTDIVRKKYIPVTIFAVLLAFCSLSSAICQSVTPQTLELNKPIEKALKGGETHIYAIELKAGQFLDLVVEQKGIDVVVSLFDPTGKKLAEVDSPNGTQGPEPLSIIVEITGNYRLEVRSMEKAAVAGRYEVKIEELRAATEKDKNRIAAEQAFAEATLLRAEGTGESLRNAIKKYEASLPLFRAIGDRSREAQTLYIIGLVYSNLGEKQQALKFFNESLPLARAVGDKSGEADTLSNIGTVYSDLGEKQQALKYYNESLPLSRAVGDKRGEAFTLGNIGTVYSALGDKQKALEYNNQSLFLTRAIGDKYGEARNLANIGVVYDSIGDKQKAIDYYNQALPPMKAVGDKQGEATTLNSIGRMYSDLGEYQKALAYYDKALTLMKTIVDKDGEAHTLNNIGMAYNLLGDQQKAIEYYNQALPLMKAVGDKRGEAGTLYNMGAVYYWLGDRPKAIDCYNQALALIKAFGDKFGEASTLNSLGVVYASFGDKQKAIESYDQALSLMKTIGDKQGEARTLANIGFLYFSAQNTQKALEYLNQALPLMKTTGDNSGAAATLYDLMLVWYSSKNPRLGLFYGKLSVNAYQQLRANNKELDKELQKTFLKSIENSFRKLANMLIDQGRFAEAQQVLNSFKDQQYFDFNSNKPMAPLALTVRETALTAGFNQKLESVVGVIRRLDNFKRTIGTRQPTAAEAEQIKALEKSLQGANDEYNAFLKTAEAEFAAPPDEKDKIPKVADVREMQAALRETSTRTKQKAAAVYTLVGDDDYRALVITPDSIDSVSFPIKGKKLNEKAIQLWRLLRTPKYDPQPLAKEIYDAVFAPIASKLPKDTKTILWSLDGNLRYVPMAALYDGRHYLAERYENVIFTRADKERMTRAVNPALAGTGMGSSEAHTVELGGEKFTASALPAVKAELGWIFKDENTGGILSGGVLLDSKFTRAAMLAELKTRRPLVHIASHFKFEPGDEARSFLLLGDGTPFTLDEMKTQKDLFAGVDLLTLSACQTAAQRPDANGREVDGFAELAQRLGAGAVMASLWEVSDNSTAELMSRFYQGYVNGGLNKADAIRQTQLALLKGDYKTGHPAERQLTQADKDAASIKIDPAKLIPFKPKKNAPYAHPYYWSPFVLIGNWK